MLSYLKDHKRRAGYLMVAICFVLVGIFTKSGQDKDSFTFLQAAS